MTSLLTQAQQEFFDVQCNDTAERQRFAREREAANHKREWARNMMAEIQALLTKLDEEELERQNKEREMNEKATVNASRWRQLCKSGKPDPGSLVFNDITQVISWDTGETNRLERRLYKIAKFLYDATDKQLTESEIAEEIFDDENRDVAPEMSKLKKALSTAYCPFTIDTWKELSGYEQEISPFGVLAPQNLTAEEVKKQVNTHQKKYQESYKYTRGYRMVLVDFAIFATGK